MNDARSLSPLSADKTLHERYPLTLDAFSKIPDGEAWLARLVELDANWRNILTPPAPILTFERPADPHQKPEYDILIAGGCFGLVVGAALAVTYGYRVLVFDRHVVGRTHRDWNISRSELKTLSAVGLFTEGEMEAFIVNEYDKGGFVKFHDEGCIVKAEKLWFDDVLNVAVSSDDFLRACRRKLEGAGGACLDGATLARAYATSDGVWLDVERRAEGAMRIGGRLLIDAMGTLSPIARQLNPRETISYVCPTVGTLATGFVEGAQADEVDYNVGEILVSAEHACANRQLLWEGFAGKPGEYTSYLFYYASVAGPGDKSLLKLFEEYFSKLREYKRPGPNWKIEKPVFGYIPGFHHAGWGQQKKTAERRVLLLGDAASMNSPLTFCGFGSLVRNIRRITHLIDLALAGEHLDARSLSHISAYEPRVAIMATFTRFMIASERDEPHLVNEILNVVMDAFHRLPPSARRGMFQDRMEWSDFVQLILMMQTLYPKIWDSVAAKLGWNYGAMWALNFAEFSAHALQTNLAALFGAAKSAPTARTEFHRYVEYYRYAPA
jgi:lycopene cyclase CruA